MMFLTVIESPYAGDVESNLAYAKRCVHDCLRRGEAPYASHLFFTQPGVLDDAAPEERALGIAAGLEWGAAAAQVAVYVDRGVSNGMRLGIAAAVKRGTKIAVRALDRALLPEDIEAVFQAGGGVAIDRPGQAVGKDVDDPVNHPRHYRSHPSGVECIDVVEHLPFNVGNAIKYLWRAGLKGALVEDLKKSRWYVDREIQRLAKGGKS